MYLHERGRDLADVVTLSVEEGHANAGLQVGPFLTGLGYSSGYGVGLRSGTCGTYEYVECNLVLFGAKSFEPDEDDFKAYGFGSALLGAFLPDDEFEEDTFFFSGSYWPAFLQVEASACLFFGLRVGLNVGEALDFILGWTTLDICGDDEKRRELTRE